MYALKFPAISINLSIYIYIYIYNRKESDTKNDLTYFTGSFL